MMECQKSSPVWGKLLCWPLRAMNTLTIPSLTFALLVKNTTKWINRVPGDPRTKSLMNLLSNKICGKKYMVTIASLDTVSLETGGCCR